MGEAVDMKINSWFKVEKVHPKIYALAEFNHWEKAVSYLLIGKTKAALFDTGMGYGDIKKEVEKITDLPVEVFLTHSHWDHIGGMNQFEKIHILDNDFELKSLKKGFSSKEVNELTNGLLFKDPFNIREYEVKGREEVLKINDNDNVLIGDLKLKVISTPGHTPGSACYFSEKLNVLFSGDLIYSGPLYAQLFESNLGDYINSIFKLKKIVNDKTIVFPGHNQMKCSPELLDEVFKGFEKLNNGKVISEIGQQNFEYKFRSFSIITNV